MDTKEFREFCKREFYKRGFKKVKSMYYLDGDKDILCGIDLQRSRFCKGYYVNVGFFIKEMQPNLPYPPYEDCDIDQRLSAISKDTYEGERYLTPLIKIEKYGQGELQPYFDKAFEEWILPAVHEGTPYFAPFFDKPYKQNPFIAHPLREEEILNYLNIHRN